MDAVARKKSSCLKIIGTTSRLPRNALPTYADVIRYINKVRFDLMTGSRNPFF